MSVYFIYISEKMPGLNDPVKKIETSPAEAAEILQSEQELSPEEQERLVSLVTDPNDSMYILGFDDAESKRLTQTQSEKLFQQVLADREVVEIFYITLTESGVDELNENEARWLKRLQEIISEE
jgi:ribonuclease HII